MPDEFVRDATSASLTRWGGVWYVPADDLYDLELDAPAVTTWKIDGVVAHARVADPVGARTVRLTRGFHLLEVEAQRRADDADPLLSAAPAGQPLRPLSSFRVFGSPPGRPWLGGLVEGGRSWLSAIWAIAVVLLALMAFAALMEVGRRRLAARVERAPRLWRGMLTASLLALVVFVAAALRVEAITETYGTVATPAWLRAVQHGVQAPLRAALPASVVWEPAPDWPHRDGPPTKYGSDPYTYLQYARGMTSFYAAHHREPVFPFATRMSLWLLHDQDVAVSFASALFSTLAVGVTFLLGAASFSRGVGLLAASALAIEHDVISWGIGGWRDDAFMFGVVASAYAMVRLRKSGAVLDAGLLGIAGGFACLVRITSLSFLVPGLLILLFTVPTSRSRWRTVGLAAALMVVLIAPYLINCWRAYGDPFYAINVHTGNYLAAEGQSETRVSTAGYVQGRFARRPFHTLDTLAIGMTSYPFVNKWIGFDRWSPALGGWLSWLALAGLGVCLMRPAGRLLIVVLATSLLPYAVTWDLAKDWRFTAHAYPFFLIAAAAAARAFLLGVTPQRTSEWWTRARDARRHWRIAAPAVAASMLLIAIVWRVFPARVAAEALAAGDDVTIGAGGRDHAFFGPGWSRPLPAGVATSRVALDTPADLYLPLPRVQDYVLALRINPFPRPLSGSAAALPLVHVAINGRPLGDLQLTWNPDRVGAYELPLSRDLVHPGSNRLTFSVEPPAGEPGAAAPPPGLAEGRAISVWYVRIRQPPPGR